MIVQHLSVVFSFPPFLRTHLYTTGRSVGVITAFPAVDAYTRSGEGEKMLVLLNFTAHTATTHIETNMKSATMLLSDYNEAPTANKTSIMLRPYEAVIYKIGQ